MKTIVFFHHGATLGGAPFSMLDIIKGADPSLYKIKVILPNQGPFFDLLREHRIDSAIYPFLVFYYCAPNKTFSFNNHPVINLRNFFKLIVNGLINILWMPVFLMRAKPDLVVLNTSTPLLCALLTRLLGIKLVWHIREIITPAPNKGIKGMMAAIINFSADQVIVNSEFSRQDVIQLGINSAKVIYNSVDLERFNLIVSRQEMRETLALSEDALVVGWTSQIGAHKGWRTLLKSAFILSKKLPNIRFLIAGASHGKKHLLGTLLHVLDEEEMFKEAVIRLGLEQHFVFLGVRQDIERVLKAMDCLVFPVESPESFGKVIIEAMASGVPVVASKIGPVGEIITDNKTGLLVEVNDAVGLVDALEDILTDRQKALRLSEEARKSVVQHFDKNKNIPKIWELYASVLNR